VRSPQADHETITRARMLRLMALLLHRHNTVITVHRMIAVVLAHGLQADSHEGCLSLPATPCKLLCPVL